MNVVMFMFKQIICTLTFELSYTVSFENSKMIVSCFYSSYFVMFIRVVIVMQDVISFHYHKNLMCFSDCCQQNEKL